MPAVEKTVTINATPDKIWNLLKDPNNWHTWFEGASPAKSVQGGGDTGTIVDTAISVANIPLPTQIKVIEANPGVKWKGEFNGLGASGHQIWTYEGAGAATKVTFRIEAELAGPAKLAEGMIIKSFDSMAEKTLNNVKVMAEA
jgi:carbon monoxide dehydrogenase subunit G